MDQARSDSRLGSLTGLGWQPEQLSTLESVLLQRAVEQPGDEPNYFDILYSLFMSKKDYKKGERASMRAYRKLGQGRANHRMCLIVCVCWLKVEGALFMPFPAALISGSF